MKRLNRKGFTLMELLLVVGMIGILVSVSMPVFSNGITRSRASTCYANRTSLKSELTTRYLLRMGQFSEGTGMSLSAADIGNYACPSGGTLTYDLQGRVFTVHCSKHQEGDEPTVIGLSADKMERLKAIMLDPDNSKGTLDSSAVSLPESGSGWVASQLAAEGIDLRALGAKSWHFEKRSGGNHTLLWTDKDINTMEVGDKVAIIQYRFDTGKYTVWESKVVQHSATFGSGSNLTTFTYKKLMNPNGTLYKPAGYNEATDQTFTKAMELLKEKQAKFDTK